MPPVAGGLVSSSGLGTLSSQALKAPAAARRAIADIDFMKLSFLKIKAHTTSRLFGLLLYSPDSAHIHPQLLSNSQQLPKFPIGDALGTRQQPEVIKAAADD